MEHSKRANMKKMSQGFTLIELTIVVAIIGTLAALAIPLYQDYMRRTYVAEGLILANWAKSSMVTYWAVNGTWPVDNDAAALPVNISGTAVRSVEVKPNGLLEITFNQKMDNGVLLMQNMEQTSTGTSWLCSAGSNFDPKFLPAGCY